MVAVGMYDDAYCMHNSLQCLPCTLSSIVTSWNSARSRFDMHARGPVEMQQRCIAPEAHIIGFTNYKAASLFDAMVSIQGKLTENTKTTSNQQQSPRKGEQNWDKKTVYSLADDAHVFVDSGWVGCRKSQKRLKIPGYHFSCIRVDALDVALHINIFE